VAPYSMVGSLCFYCDCIFFQHLKMGLHVIINGEQIFESSKNIQLHVGNRQNENYWLMNLGDKVGLH